MNDGRYATASIMAQYKTALYKHAITIVIGIHV